GAENTLGHPVVPTVGAATLAVGAAAWAARRRVCSRALWTYAPDGNATKLPLGSLGGAIPCCALSAMRSAGLPWKPGLLDPVVANATPSITSAKTTLTTTRRTTRNVLLVLRRCQ